MTGPRKKSAAQLAAEERKKRGAELRAKRLEDRKKAHADAAAGKPLRPAAVPKAKRGGHLKVADLPATVQVERKVSQAVARNRGKDTRTEDRAARNQADQIAQAEIDAIHGKIERGEEVSIADAVAPVMRRVLAGEPLDKALEPALPFAVARLMIDTAAKGAVGAKAAEAIIERVAGKPVQPIRQDGPVTIVFLTGALPPEDQPPPLEIEDGQWEDEPS